jgi:hypothetical protein
MTLVLHRALLHRRPHRPCCIDDGGACISLHRHGHPTSEPGCGGGCDIGGRARPEPCASFRRIKRPRLLREDLSSASSGGLVRAPASRAGLRP